MIQRSTRAGRLAPGNNGQGMTEYVLVFALVAVVFGLAAAAWKVPIAHYLLHLAQVIVKTR